VSFWPLPPKPEICARSRGSAADGGAAFLRGRGCVAASLFRGQSPCPLWAPGIDRDSRRNPSPPRRAWRNPWRESATRQSFGETSHPGGRSPSRHPRGAAETAAVGGSRSSVPLGGTTPLGRSEGSDDCSSTPGIERLYSAAPGHDRGATASGGGSQRERLATCLVLPEEVDAFKISIHAPCGERMQYAACVQIPGLDAPIALALPEQRGRSRRLLCIKALQRPVAGSAGPIPSTIGQDTQGVPVNPGLLRHPERGVERSVTMSAHGPKATSARGVPLAKRAAVTQAARRYRSAASAYRLARVGQTGPRLPCADLA